MSDKEVHTKFLKLFQGFLKDIIVTMPQYSETLTNTYEGLLNRESITNLSQSKQITKFADCIYDNNTVITKRDRAFFDSDPPLLQGISMKQLWNGDITPKNRNTIWKYLQSFCILIMNIRSSENLKNLLQGEDSSESLDKQDLKQLKKLSQLTETVQTREPEPEGMGLESLLNSSSIGKLAKDIAENLDIGDIDMGSGDTMDLSKIMQSTDFMGIFNKINEQVQDKFQKGEIDDSLLSSEAEQMLPTMMNNPFFQNMMKSDMFQNLDTNVDKAKEK